MLQLGVFGRPRRPVRKVNCHHCKIQLGGFSIGPMDIDGYIKGWEMAIAFFEVSIGEFILHWGDIILIFVLPYR